MTDTRCVIGTDGGNTKSNVVVADLGGAVLAAAAGGCTDIYGHPDGETAAIDELDRIFTDALERAGRTPQDVVTSVWSLAGADWPEDRALLRDALTELLDGRHEPVVVNDSIGPIRLGSRDWNGVGVVVGTGNAVGARNLAGDTYHVGFWPDEVGAVAMSGRALAAVYRDGLGLGPSTSLTDRALHEYGCDDVEGLLHSFTKRGPSRYRDRVRMSPILLDEADRGDPVALDLVTWAGSVLGQQAALCARQVGIDRPGVTVVLAGGIFRHPSRLIERGVMEHFVSPQMHRSATPPVVAAVMLALDRCGVEADARQLAEMVEAALPPV